MKLEKLPNLAENEIHIWYGNTALTKDFIPKYYNLLSLDEKEKAKKFRFEKDANQFICCRSLLRILSAHYLNTVPKSINFSYGKYNKPDYNPSKSLKFNVSHSGDYGMIGFALNSEIGVDVEKIKSNFDAFDIAQNFFSELEIKALKNIDIKESKEAFFRCWTRKEGFIKAKSKGLSFPLDAFSVSLDSDSSAELLETKWNHGEKKIWSLYSFKPAEEYISAICVNHHIKKVQYYNWDDHY